MHVFTESKVRSSAVDMSVTLSEDTEGHVLDKLYLAFRYASMFRLRRMHRMNFGGPSRNWTLYASSEGSELRSPMAGTGTTCMAPVAGS